MEQQYRYKLKPYKIPSDRQTCPQCGTRHSLSPYVDSLTNENLPEIYGRCNREVNCGYHLSPYHDGYSKMICENERGSDVGRNTPKLAYVPPRSPPQVDIPAELFKSSLTQYEKNGFVTFLLSIFPPEVVQKLIADYYIGTSSRWDGATVFWFINSLGQVRAGQIKQFDKSGHTRKETKRNGEVKSCTTWIHSVLSYKFKKQGVDQPKWLSAYESQPNRVNCLFGEHLLNRHPLKPIALFESPKTAIIAAPYFPDYLCMATGSLSYLTKGRLSSLHGRNVVLFPDLSTDGKVFNKWFDKAKLYGDLINFQVSDLLEKNATAEEKEQGLDIADYLVKLNYSVFSPSLPETIETNQQPDEDNTPLPQPVIVETATDYPPLDSALSGMGTIEYLYPRFWSRVTRVRRIFEEITLPPGPFKLNTNTKIVDLPLFVATHLSFVETKQNRAYEAYLERLEILAEKLGRLDNTP